MAARYSKKLFELNSNWTSRKKRQDWNHFRISSRRKGTVGIELEMMAVCDRSVRFWVSLAELKDAELWQPGWQDCTEG